MCFSLASINLGTDSELTVSTTTSHIEGSEALPAAVTVCQSDPATAECLNPTTPAASTSFYAPTGSSATFSLFVTSTEAIPTDLARNRIFVYFTDELGVIRGATSVAVRTQP